MYIVERFDTAKQRNERFNELKLLRMKHLTRYTDVVPLEAKGKFKTVWVVAFPIDEAVKEPKLEAPSGEPEQQGA